MTIALTLTSQLGKEKKRTFKTNMILRVGAKRNMAILKLSENSMLLKRGKTES